MRLCDVSPLALQSSDHVIGADTRPAPAVNPLGNVRSLFIGCLRWQAFTGAAAAHMTSGRFYLADFSHNCIRIAAVSAREAVDHSRDLRRGRNIFKETAPIEIAMHSSARYPLQNHSVLKN